MGIFNRSKALKPEEKNYCKEKMDNSIRNIHKNWVIGILSFLVIVLSAIIISSCLFDKENVSTIISFTATILSIVLSLLAILYSYFGSMESSYNLSEIRSAVAEIKATEDAIKHFMSSGHNDNQSERSNRVDDGIVNETPTNNRQNNTGNEEDHTTDNLPNNSH
jgi:hypothetical protein